MAIKKKYTVLLIILILIIVGVLFYYFCVRFVQVKNDEVAIKVNLSDSSVEVLRGDIVYMPLRSSLYIYPTTIQTVQFDTTMILVQDGMQFPVAPSISYRLDAKKAGEYYTFCGMNFKSAENTFLKHEIAVAYRDAASNFTADSMMYNITQFEKEAANRLTEKLEGVGLDLISLNANLAIPIQMKQIMALRFDATQKAIIAQSQIEEADAKRKVDSLHYASLTPLAIQEMFIKKWDGKLADRGELPQVYKDITGKEITENKKE